jgi:biuret amidohydrolase
MTDVAEKQRQRLRDLLVPEHTALLTMELQRGVVGDTGSLPALTAEVKASGLIPNVSRLAAAARDKGVRVAHCTVVARADGAGFKENCRIFAVAAKQARAQGHWSNEIGTPGAELIPELAGDPRDIEVPRIHGMTPFTSTSLDQILRNMGITTVIATGVSVNLGIYGMTLSALDLGYQVVIPRDAVVGVPAEYAQQVLDNSLSLVATVVTTDDVLDAWA